MSKLDDLLSWQRAGDLTESEKRDGKQQIKDLMLELIDSCETRHGFSENDLRQKVQEL